MLDRTRDPRSLFTLINWIKTKPADEQYSFYDCMGKCFFSQYCIDTIGEWRTGLHGVHPVWSYWHDDDDRRDIAVLKPRTFGEALKRAEALLEKVSS